MELDVSDVVDELTLEEKLQLVHGTSDPDGTATGYLPGIDRVTVPPLRMVDGPLGVRAMGERASAFPASVALAATWDPSLACEFGTALGRETAAHGQDIILGPGVNIARVPHGGRNFEYYTEDPHLNARLAVGTIEGIESAGVGASIKHFVANNQETNRYEVSAEVDERALREIYLPAFRAAVEETDITSVMTAYNRVNGIHMSDHASLLADVLKGEWGFDGFVVSDWWGTRSTIAAANAGLDLEMPGIGPEEYIPGDEIDEEDLPDAMPPVPDVPALFGDPLREAIESGEVDEGVLDEKVERILRAMNSIERLDEDGPDGALDTEEHRQLARDVATEGTVLLKNDGALPLDDVDSVAVIGSNADEAKLGGGGSSEVTPLVETSPVEGLSDRDVEVTFERGVPRISETSFFEEDAADGEESEASVDAAVAAASDADCAVVVVQDDATEFADRESLELPGEQDELVSAVAEAADRTAVVLRTSGPVEMPWLDAVDAVLETWYPGQADGAALADVIFGDTDPGGRLPVTFGRSAADYPTSDETTFPGIDDEAQYDEGIFVGYRYFDEEGIEPAFPFGHGESYTEFEYNEANVTETDGRLRVEVDIRNVGDRAGKEVVQTYARKAAAPVPCPDRELIGFEALRLDPGERATVVFSLDQDDFAYYDEEEGWTVPSGTNEVLVGRSSRDIRTSLEVDLSMPDDRSRRS